MRTFRALTRLQSSLLICTIFITTIAPAAAFAQDARTTAGGPSPVSTATNSGPKSGDEKDAAKKPAAPFADPLIGLLVGKAVITDAEGRAIASSGGLENRDRLAALLLAKGLITAGDLDSIRVAQPAASVPSPTALAAATVPARAAEPPKTAPAAPAAQTVVPAVTPLRVLQFEAAKRDGLIPDIKLGSGAKLKLYGFFKTSAVWDSSNPSGTDFPLPGFLADSGPSGSPEFHLKVRAFRVGANFEWLDPAPKTSVTGKIELDFEGDFTRSVNRNISSIRSSQPSIRLAWARIDRVFDDKRTGFVLFGQDWTPFGSSTMPNSIETTGFHLAYGNIYERAPQIRTGVNFLLSKNRNVRFQPEFAFVLPMFGNTPSDAGNQLGFGERQGPDSNRPELQGRFVMQFQLDKAAGVAPAQLIASWTYGRRRVVLSRANVPAAYLSAFSSGAELESARYGYTAEWQLPTRWFTLIGKVYEGADLRAYFGGQLFSTYNDVAGLTNTTTATSIDGSSTVVFGLLNGAPTIAAQNAVRGYGGFINLGIPLSRLLGADPKGSNAGWTAYLHYGLDGAFARDARRLGAVRGRSDAAFASLQYRLNSYVTFALEQSLFRTRAANNSGALPLFRGVPSRETHNVRSEFATIFNF